MLRLDWQLVLEAYQERARGIVLYTTSELTAQFLEPLEAMQVEFTPYWVTTTACMGIRIPIGDKREEGIHIQRVPKEHRALQQAF